MLVCFAHVYFIGNHRVDPPVRKRQKQIDSSGLLLFFHVIEKFKKRTRWHIGFENERHEESCRPLVLKRRRIKSTTVEIFQFIYFFIFQELSSYLVSVWILVLWIRLSHGWMNESILQCCRNWDSFTFQPKVKWTEIAPRGTNHIRRKLKVFVFNFI